MRKFLSLHSLLSLICLLLVANNIKYVFVFIMSRQKVLNEVYFEPGYQFHTFLPHLKGVEKAGYVTDLSINRESNDGAYLQAQYYLAPTILELEDINYPYFIIDSKNTDFIIRTIKETKARRLANNEYGQALMKRPAP
ncbi:MAG: hypothetical protein KC618_06425 [Candidatus Omnitrophica bacterium]|nr:hypothetical protein [Candidatus Omnitrophota bacterium]